MFIILQVCYGIYAFLLYFDALSVFQQSGYKRKKWINWLRVKSGKLSLRTFFAVLPLLFISVEKDLFGFDDRGYFVFIFLSLIICQYVHLSVLNIKVRAKFTKRFIRESVLSVCLFTSFCVLFDYLLNRLLLLKATYSYLFIIVFPLFLLLSNFVFMPYEKAIYALSVKKCKTKLSKKRGLIKIGITGSYGKTSVKEFLNEMLRFNYKTYATPKSFNTPLGICIAVKNMPKDCEVFIAEMGARKVGDIKELADMVRPDIGIITAIGSQHLETFGTVENVKKCKYELIEGLDSSGVAIFSIETQKGKELYEDELRKKISVGFLKGDVHLKNISIGKGRTDFDLIVFGKKYSATTTLIGRHNLLNIALAAAAAYSLGVKGERIVAAIKRLKAPKHRLEVIETSSGLTVIDDGYNANIEGVKSAAEALKLFEGKKFAVVSGLVECGEKIEELNVEVGKVMGEAADVVLAVGANSEYVLKGARECNCETFFAKTLDEAKSVLKGEVKSGDVVIFINDLPDIYEL